MTPAELGLLGRISRLVRLRARLHALGIECGVLDPILNDMTQRLRDTEHRRIHARA